MPDAREKNPIEVVLAALEGARVRYLIVGGVAVVLHGRLRTTADLDLWIELERENLDRAARTLGALGYRPRAPVRLEDLGNPELRRSWIEEKGLLVLSLWRPNAPLEVDLFVREPFAFQEAHARGVVVHLESTEAHVIGLDDLLVMKRGTGRALDAEDVQALESLRDEGGNG